MEIVSLYGQGYVVEKQTVFSPAPESIRISKYVVREPIVNGKTYHVLDESTDVAVGDYVYVYLVEATDALARTILVKRTT